MFCVFDLCIKSILVYQYYSLICTYLLLCLIYIYRKEQNKEGDVLFNYRYRYTYYIGIILNPNTMVLIFRKYL